MNNWICCTGEFVITRKKKKYELRKRNELILLCRWIVMGANRPRIGVSIQIPGLELLLVEESKNND